MMHSRSRASVVLGAIVALAASPRAQESQARFDAPVIVAGETVRFEILLDLNGDGFQDVVDWLYTQSTGTGVRVGGWINDGSGRLVNAWNVPLSFPSGIDEDLQDAAAGNLNGDRFDDFALTFDEQVLLFVSNGDLPPTQIASLDAGGAHLSIVLADFDGDGLDDLASSDGSATIRLNEGGGVFVPAEAGWSTLGGLPQYDDLHAVDVDDDGSPDLADIGGGSLYLHT
ncbi:MAG TPA: FG-GAP-like repeat-containing protein, partial [Planctomycetota bacterium]|nr:FG-GAP-like repeat-containing protein [Planctomycetota bacterium]